jgi:hypothetical protein
MFVFQHSLLVLSSFGAKAGLASDCKRFPIWPMRISGIDLDTFVQRDLPENTCSYLQIPNRWCSGEANDLLKLVVPFPALVPLLRLETVPPSFINAS